MDEMGTAIIATMIFVCVAFVVTLFIYWMFGGEFEDDGEKK